MPNMIAAAMHRAAMTSFFNSCTFISVIEEGKKR